MNDHWRVTVSRNGEDLITIETSCLCGKESFTDEEADTIREAARHLLAFIGEKSDDDIPGTPSDQYQAW